MIKPHHLNADELDNPKMRKSIDPTAFAVDRLAS